MAIVLRFDGTNDYVSTPSFTLNTGAIVEVRFRILTNQTFSWLSAGPSATNAFIRWNGTTLRARGNQTGPNVNVPNGINIADGEFHVVQLHVGATTHRFNVDGFDTADLSGDVSTSMHDTIGAFFNSYFDGDIEYLEITNNGSDNRRWDANSSTTGPGPTVLAETVNNSDGTGVNFPTDGSQWIDTGDGAVTVNLATKSYIYNGNSISVDVSSDITVSLSSASYSYGSNSLNVDITPEIIINFEQGNYSVSAQGMDITPTITVNLSQGDYSLSSDKLIVDAGSNITIPLSQGLYNLSGEGLSVVSTGEIDINLSSANYTYNGNRLIISIGEPTEIGTVTASFKENPVSVNFSINNVTVNFKG